MPLKDRDRSTPRRLVRLGIIRLGHKETKTYQGGKTVEYPVQDDHFVLTDAPEIAEVYGPAPRELDVVLPFGDIARNFDAWYQVWAGGVLCCKGDGELVDYASPFTVDAVQGRNGKTHTRVHRADGDTLVSGGVATRAFTWDGQSFKEGDHVPCPGAAKGLYPHCAICQKSAILKVMMADPKLIRLGYYQLATGSGRNYDTINGMLEWVHGEIGSVNAVRYHLSMVEEATTFPDTDGVRKPTRRWFLHIEPFREDLAAIYEKRRRVALAMPASVAALTAGDDDEAIVDPDTGEIIVDEDAPPPFAEVQSDTDEGYAEDDAAPETNAPPEPEAEPEAQTPPEVQAAMDYTTKSGKRLGQMSIGELEGILEWCDAQPADKVATPRKHVLTLLDYMRVFEQPADDEQETLL
jgi:hypothetical protein